LEYHSLSFQIGEKMSKKGKLFVISGPSGVGKGTLVTEILKRNPNIKLSVSVTTRAPRPGEQDGVNYHFLTKEKFQSLIESNQLIEWAQFADNYYGTYEKVVNEVLDSGYDLIVEIEVQGALQIKSKRPDASLIFILPPSLEELKDRLERRRTESAEVIAKRLAIVDSEYAKKDNFNYQMVNDRLDASIEELENIINQERMQNA
jgi:guanylate kinase